MGLWHIDTLDFGNVKHFQFPSAWIAVLGFFPDSGFLPSRTGSRTPRPPVLLDFVGIFSPFPRKNKQPQPAALNYPFDFAFFAHEAPGRCPLIQVPEILTAPTVTGRQGHGGSWCGRTGTDSSGYRSDASRPARGERCDGLPPLESAVLPSDISHTKDAPPA